MQAQDYNMVKWAMGLRLHGSTRDTIENAIERGDIVRTHLLRPTWHFVAANDLRWLIKLTAPQIRTAMRSRHKQLGITAKVAAKSNKVIEQALSGEIHLTRTELVNELEAAGFENQDNRASHLLVQAELDGVIRSSPTKGKNSTYALMDDRVTEFPKLNNNESLEKLARIYFRSHGPATLEDFVWWSGLNIADARNTMEMVEQDFLSAEVNSQKYWFPELSFPAGDENQSVFLVPSYDEFLISYKDRSASISENVEKKAISNNGIFRPIIVVDGEVVGIWKRSKEKTKVTIETEFFKKPSIGVRQQVESVGQNFGKFLGVETVEVKYHWG